MNKTQAWAVILQMATEIDAIKLAREYHAVWGEWIDYHEFAYLLDAEAGKGHIRRVTSRTTLAQYEVVEAVEAA